MSQQAAFDKAISMAVNTGKAIYGTKRAIKNIKRGEGKVFILANNCLSETKEEMYFRADKAKLPIIEYPKNSWELGAACGRPHKISVLTIMDAGDSKILEFVEEE